MPYSQTLISRSLIILAISIVSFSSSSLSLNAKNVGIIIDRSLSVAEQNRNEASELIIDLLEGKTNPSIAKNWTLSRNQTDEQNPVQLKLRKQQQQRIENLLQNKAQSGLADTELKLLTGHFGDLKTVHQLAKEPWKNAGKNYAELIRKKTRAATPSDPRTHLELAKATAAGRLNKNDEFYLFVISDGVEDLKNWPVSDYLDKNKINDPKSLAMGDFRDINKAQFLRKLNRNLYEKYPPKDKKKLKAFKEGFSELLIGKISLNGTRLLDFFSKNPKKVPVSIYVYYFKPRPKLEPQFILPLRSSESEPYQISKNNSALKWILSSVKNATFPNCKQTIQLSDSNQQVLGKHPIDKNTADINKLFPNLKDGKYKVLIETTDGIEKAQAISYIEINHYKPQILFTNIYGKADPKNPVVFRKTDDISPLQQKITWKFYSDKGDITPPKKIVKKILHYEPDDDKLPNDEDQLIYDIKYASMKSQTISDLLADEDAAEASIPLGGAYRIILEATWATGEKSTTTTYFTLPNPELIILGNASSEDSARIIEKGDFVRIANWMHGWKGFEYELEVEEFKDNQWIYLDSDSESNPLKLSNTTKQGVTIEVAKNPTNPIRYKIAYLPNEKNKLADIIDPTDMTSAYSYAESKPFSVIPVLFGAFILLTLGFFWNHYFRKK